MTAASIPNQTVGGLVPAHVAREPLDRLEPRADAVRALAALIATGQNHIIGALPGLPITELGITLSELPGWTVYADFGEDVILRTVTLLELLLAHVKRPTAAVAVIPADTVPTEIIAYLTAHPVPLPGTAPLLLHDSGQWPAILGEAVQANRQSPTRKPHA